jgi:hypothetical protein
MIEKSAPVFVQLGRFGDLIQLLPAWKAIHDRTGADPIVMVATDYANVFDGVSYIQPFPVHGHWYQQVNFARDLARQHFGGAIVPQWWNTMERSDEILDEQSRGATVLQSHGINHGVNMAIMPDYGSSMWYRCGFTRDEMMTLPLVFDRRNLEREASFADLVLGKNNTKPIVLYNFSGVSSPFAYVPEVMKTVLKYSGKFKFIDLGRIVAHRIFDLLGLYDRSAGLITIDSATLHLAPATKINYFAYLVDGWSQSVPKANCFRAVPYSQCLARLAEMDEYLQSL